jgi:iron complex outermembrane receptor protein
MYCFEFAGRRLAGALLLSAAFASPVAAQRTGENAVRSADDAFGTSVGNERVGLYSAFGARGFSPVQAGNVRIEGLYFDYQADLQDRLISGSNVRVGLSAQSYPFPAPTGVADFSLRKAGVEPVLSVLAGYGPFGSVRLEADGQLPVTEGLSVAGGAGIQREELYYGGDRTVINAAIIPRWQPSDELEIIPFWSISDYRGQEPQPIIFTSGAFLPPRIKRREYFGQPWARNGGRGINYGVISTAQLDEWTLRAGLFRSLNRNDDNFADLALNTDRNGVGDRFIIAEKDRRFGSVSGELRASRRFDEGDRRHIIHLAARGREQKRRYGGGQPVFLGRARVDERIDFDEPEFAFGPQTNDKVRQFTAGLGYEGRWRNRGELSLGIQKTSYRKDVDKPAGSLPPSKDSPWLMNGTLSVYASKDLVFYAGYTKGLEESPVAPEAARNRGEAPPAIITEQMDAGLRYAFNDNLRLVAGLFDVKKPYYALDSSLLFANLGTVRHRGVELSLAGQLAPGLNVVAGTVFLDATLSGEALEQGLVGKRPVNAIGRTSSAAVDYRLPWVEGLSVDVSYESTSDRTANRQNTLIVPARYVWSPGFRYRFNIGDKPATLRGQVASANNVYGYNVIGEGVYYNVPRRFSLSLVTDI